MRLNQFESMDQEADLPISLFVMPVKVMGWMPISRGVRVATNPPLVSANGTLLGDAALTSVQSIMKPGMGLTGVVQFTATLPIFARNFSQAQEALDALLIEFLDTELNGELEQPSVRICGVVTMIKPGGDIIQLFDHGAAC
jgi:hypothetical protein